MFVDPSGYFWQEALTIFGFAAATAAVLGITILTLGVAAAPLVGLVASLGFGIGVGVSLVSQLAFTGSVDIGLALLDGLTGAMSARMTLLPIGAIGSATFGSIISGGSYIASSSYLGSEMTVDGMKFAMVSGFFCGLLAGPGGLKDSVSKLNYLNIVSKDLVSPKKILRYASNIVSTQSKIIISSVRSSVSIVASQIGTRYYVGRFE
mgnify:CR=1 FL=1